ncbi:unnamed protein product [Nyctereutes procyonoides]|uniref:(raccoon dog) hypothetical protein n=1 Tax=Nyctereutes procyonoides TaxID=34880 RepID=A0A811ZE83_NYCPR|nr:unnamed protein product [Nyctereutes procyonoides]
MATLPGARARAARNQLNPRPPAPRGQGRSAWVRPRVTADPAQDRGAVRDPAATCSGGAEAPASPGAAGEDLLSYPGPEGTAPSIQTAPWTRPVALVRSPQPRRLPGRPAGACPAEEAGPRRGDPPAAGGGRGRGQRLRPPLRRCGGGASRLPGPSAQAQKREEPRAWEPTVPAPAQSGRRPRACPPLPGAPRRHRPPTYRRRGGGRLEVGELDSCLMESKNESHRQRKENAT